MHPATLERLNVARGLLAAAGLNTAKNFALAAGEGVTIQHCNDVDPVYCDPI